MPGQEPLTFFYQAVSLFNQECCFLCFVFFVPKAMEKTPDPDVNRLLSSWCRICLIIPTATSDYWVSCGIAAYCNPWDTKKLDLFLPEVTFQPLCFSTSKQGKRGKLKKCVPSTVPLEILVVKWIPLKMSFTKKGAVFGYDVSHQWSWSVEKTTVSSQLMFLNHSNFTMGRLGLPEFLS